MKLNDASHIIFWTIPIFKSKLKLTIPPLELFTVSGVIKVQWLSPKKVVNINPNQHLRFT